MAGDVGVTDMDIHLNSEDHKSCINEDVSTTSINPFSVLPPEMLAEIFLHVDSKCRQKVRAVSYFWKQVVDTYYGICLLVTNMNWNSVEDCNMAKSIILNGFSRDVKNPSVITSRLTKLEITDFAAYYSFMPLLEECHLLQSLVFNCVTFLQRSQLVEYTSSDYLERKGKNIWLPRLKHFKFVSCTTQGGVYNHLVPTGMPETYGMEDFARASYDISRGEMEFLPFILQILTFAKSLAHVEMTLTDIWKIPFTDILQVTTESSVPSLDVSLWHFGSKQILPVAKLLQKVNSISTLQFNFPYHFDQFYMKFKPRLILEENDPYQLEEVIVHQSFRWSQEMSQVDIPWLQILEKQNFLKTLEYPFPVLGNDARMAAIILQNCQTLKKIIFTGHREERQLLEDFRAGHIQPWDSQWFSNCEVLEELSLQSSMRFILTPANTSTIINLGILPQSLKHFKFHGCVDTGNLPLSNIFFSLVNLESFTHQARLCPWFKVEGLTISQLQITHCMDIILSLPKLKRWTLEWYDTSASTITNALINSQCSRQAAYLPKQLLDWISTMKTNFAFTETSSLVDRQLKSLVINILTRSFQN